MAEALLRERIGYVVRGLTDRVAAVDAALTRLGHRTTPRETAVAPPAENAMQPKPIKHRRSRNG